MSIISNTLLGGANDPGIRYGSNPTYNPMINALRGNEAVSSSFGNAGTTSRSTASAPSQSNQSRSSGIGLGTIGKGLSALGGLTGAPALGTLGGALSMASSLRGYDPAKTTTTADKVGMLGKGLTALGAVNPAFGALGGLVNAGVGAYNSYTGGWMGDALDSRDDEASLDALEAAGFSRTDARSVVGSWSARTGGEAAGNEGIGQGSDKAGPGGVGGVSGADMGKGGEDW